jgi:hypothetical protein
MLSNKSLVRTWTQRQVSMNFDLLGYPVCNRSTRCTIPELTMLAIVKHM